MIVVAEQAKGQVRIAAQATDGQHIAVADNVPRPIEIPACRVTVLPLPTRLVAKFETPNCVVTVFVLPNRFRELFLVPPYIVTVFVYCRQG